MSDSFSRAYQRLLVLRGVNCGLTGTDDVSIIAGRFGISDERVPELIAYLNSQGIDIISAEQKNQLLSDKLAGYCQKEREDSSGPDYRAYDQKLDSLLSSDLERVALKNWLYRLYQCRHNGLGTVAFMKLAGMPAEDIAGILGIPSERVYYFEYRILLHYQYTCRNLIHLRMREEKQNRISDYSG